MDPEKILNMVQMQVRWAELEPFRDDDVMDTLSKTMNTISKKFNNAEMLLADGETKVVPGEAIAENLKPKIVMALNPDLELNREFLKLYYQVVLSVDTVNSSSMEKQLQIRDLSILLEVMQYNNELRMIGGTPVTHIEGLKYFWKHANNEHTDPNEAARSFCLFVSEVAYATKRMNSGSDQGYLETLNVLAIRHQNNKENFRSLSVDEMISKVSW